MDRTNEFQSMLGPRGARSTVPGADVSNSSSNQELAARTGFNTEAARIGQEIHIAQLKLDEVGKLVRQRSIFNDSSARIAGLTDSIANDIAILTGKVEGFSSLGRDTSNPQMRQYAESLVQTLRHRLSEIVKGLQEVSELRMRVLQEQESRKSKFSFAPNIASQTAGYAPVPSANPDDPEMGAMTMTASSYQTSRLSSVHGVQRTIVELGQIFSKMASTIQQQEEMVSRIDSDVDAADLHIKEGSNQLLIYYKSISSNRKLFLKIFLILILFAFVMALTS